VTQDYVLELKNPQEARARFGEVQARLYEKLAGETLELRQLRKAWEKCGDEDRRRFLQTVLSELGSKGSGEPINPDQGGAVHTGQ